MATVDEMRGPSLRTVKEAPGPVAQPVARLDLQTLPLEILHDIAQWLDLCSLIALRQTSRWLYWNGDYDMMLGLYAGARASRSDRLQFLAFLERDTPPSQQRRWTCSACVQTHLGHLFAPWELASPAEGRVCQYAQFLRASREDYPF
ncbi:MAG: hypothetical protein M1838_004749 [Thelocarpon superellum]|nr:MAG: hypothetical protein M1838_004749 [Thelocarpon superellum]